MSFGCQSGETLVTSQREAIYYEVRDRIGFIVLNKPQKRNALNFKIWSLLPQLCRQGEDDPNVGVIIIRGEGLEAFSAGGDISEFPSLRSDSESSSRYHVAVDTAVRTVWGLRKPTIAQVCGFCVGGGAELAIACDLRFAASNVKIGITPANLGLVYPWLPTQMLVNLVGPSRAKDILFSGRLLGAPEAYEYGLIDRVFPLEDIDVETEAYALLLLEKAPNSILGSKLMVNAISQGDYNREKELDVMSCDSATSAQHKEGIIAFLEKRKPLFPPV
ncbi:MAG: enoyl-CoA hydratase-related protein [Peptococcaceae bacterium]|jgi:enoyl-CoA hydratase/carnithine racemase|nr:enoyl-CoA hydratase-related protein [Peptococcaceae bacterium]